MQYRGLTLVIFALGSRVVSTALGPGSPSCLRWTPAGDGLTLITFLREDAAGAHPLYLSRWSEDARLVSCHVHSDSLVTERYRALCDTSDGQGLEIPLKFNISVVLDPDAPCMRVSSSSAPQSEVKSRSKRSWVFPGTLWCGAGSKAVRHDQLGEDSDLIIDSCCFLSWWKSQKSTSSAFCF